MTRTGGDTRGTVDLLVQAEPIVFPLFGRGGRAGDITGSKGLDSTRRRVR